jgi:hypothetical protein
MKKMKKLVLLMVFIFSIGLVSAADCEMMINKKYIIGD